MISPRILAILFSSALGLCATEARLQATEPEPQAVAKDLVHWRSWSADLPEVARQAGKPIYVFAGSRLSELAQATVRQSFANAETADYLNQSFVCVLVDLDEQGVLGAAIRVHLNLLRQADGVPLHLWLSPDLNVIEATAYLPPTEEWGKTSFIKYARQVGEAWRLDPANCGAKIADTLAQAAEAFAEQPLPSADAAAVRTLLDETAARWRDMADATNGGFGEAPKQPQPELLRFLLARAGPDRELALGTLRRMANSALRDPLDGGFFKYSTDIGWRLPSLQKRLVDQARLALAYLDADAIKSDPVMQEAARGALDYSLSRLALPAGGYAFAEDGTAEPHNAAFLWSADEIGAALGADAPAFFTRHQVQPAGNLSEEQDPGARLKGLNILVSQLPAPPEAVAQLAKVAALRQGRGAPVRDERAFAGPQALLLAAFSRAATQLQEPRYRAAADRLYLGLCAFISDGPATTVRRLQGSNEEATPTDLAALALGFRAYAQAAGKPEAGQRADALLRKLVTESLELAHGEFLVPPLPPKTGFLTYRIPALAEPCHAEALALLAGLGGKDAALVRAGIIGRLGREDDASGGDLLLALGASSAE